MIPILYTHEETHFLTNGIGRLSDCISCEVTEERNGIFECEFVYPITGKHYSDIKEGMLIYCTHDDTQDPQPFEIYKRSAVIDGTVTFNAHHISYRLSNIVVEPFTMTGSVGQALDALTEHAIGGSPFVLRTTKGTTGTFNVKTPDSIRARLGGVEGSILDVFDGGEYLFDKFTVTLYAARGVDNGVSIRYGKNLTDITADRSIEGRYTGVVPFWADEGGQIVTLPEWYILASNMPVNTDYWTDEDDTIIRAESGEPLEFTHFDIELAPMDLSDQWTEPPAVEQLRAKAQSRLEASKAWETEENVDVDFVALWQTPEYEDVAALQRVRLCDTVSVYYPAFEVELKKKVIRTVYNVLLDRYSELELGEAQSSFVDVIRERTVDLMAGYVKSDAMQAAVDNATNLIQGGLGGHVVMKTNADGQPEEILIMDTDSIETAVHVIRMNQNGIGFSSNGYQGPFETAWTIDGGFVADFITSGTLSADHIKTGSIDGSIDISGDLTVHTNAVFDRLAYIFTGISVSTTLDKTDPLHGYAGFHVVTRQDANSAGMLKIFPALNRSVFVGRSIITYTESKGNYCLENDVLMYIDGKLYSKGLNCAESIVCDAGIYPSGDGAAAFRIGQSTNRWYQVWTTSLNFLTGVYINYSSTNDYIYASKTIHQASDERKKNVYEYDERYDDLLEMLEPIIYEWKDHPTKKHVGLGARRTAELMQEIGIEDGGFVGIDIDDTGEEVYSVDYQELTTMLLHTVQKQQNELDAMKKQLESVMERLERLEGINADT